MLAAVFYQSAKNQKMERPSIINFFSKGTTLEQAHDAYSKSPELYKYMAAVDSYADFLESKLDEIANPIKYMRMRLEEGQQLNGMFANSMSDSANYLKEIAREALSANGS